MSGKPPGEWVDPGNPLKRRNDRTVP